MMDCNIGCLVGCMRRSTCYYLWDSTYKDIGWKRQGLHIEGNNFIEMAVETRKLLQVFHRFAFST